MNVFVLDESPHLAARYHCDRHISKMCLESTQILCTVSRLYGIEAPYKSTHINHPVVKWCAESIQNWDWVYRLGISLCVEYSHRYHGGKKDHKCGYVLLDLVEPPLPRIPMTERPQCMPDQYKVPGDPVQAYRNYYIGDKSRFAKWNHGKTPWWYSVDICL